MDALERIVAIQEIRDQIARYAILFDDKSWDEFAELWAEDAVWEGPGMVFEGRAELMRFLSTCLPADYNGKHMNSPPLIELTGPERARARTDVVWITHDFANQIVARYDDVFKRVDGRWVFERRTEIVVPYKEGPPPMSDTAIALSGDTMRPVTGAEGDGR
jgi:uncharacterized protein (TIGR02246 family)